MIGNKLRAALVIARRDFLAVVLSKTFLFFLIGPLFPIVVGAMAGGIARTTQDVDKPEIGVLMSGADGDALLAARAALAARMAGPVPEFVVLRRLDFGGEGGTAAAAEARAALADRGHHIAAVIGGTLARPTLTGTAERIDQWQGMVGAIAARAASAYPGGFPEVRAEIVATSRAKTSAGQIVTAQAGQTLLFLLTMLLAGMVLSNLVEEKSNKIIEVLAAAIPMDALFLGKLFAMLAVSLVGIAVWAVAWGVAVLAGGAALPALPAPAVGWPAFLVLGFLYFAMAYLLLGSLFLAIGGMASTVREVQTLSMPVTMLQLLVFFFASYALARRGQWIDSAALVFPFSSPFAMLARAAMDQPLWPHLIALGWQALWVALFVSMGARLFRRTVMKSGPARGRAARRGALARA